MTKKKKRVNIVIYQAYKMLCKFSTKNKKKLRKIFYNLTQTFHHVGILELYFEKKTYMP